MDVPTMYLLLLITLLTLTSSIQSPPTSSNAPGDTPNTQDGLELELNDMAITSGVHNQAEIVVNQRLEKIQAAGQGVDVEMKLA